MGETHTQHNPNASGDVAGFAEFLRFLRENHPLSRGVITRICADGNYVILHVLERRHPDDRSTRWSTSSGSKAARSSSIGT